METIGKREIRSFLSSTEKPANTTNSIIRHDEGHRVENFLDLAKKVAALQFANPQFLFLFRGQSNDYKNQKKNSSLQPSIFRPKRDGSKLTPELLMNRFNFLAKAEEYLVNEYEQKSEIVGDGALKLKRQRILRWSILQHYEICFTPLLDVSQSLRVAASFATSTNSEKAFIYVLGVPNLNGTLTANAEAGLQIIRLSGVCPPSAVRPHIQEGYLLGEYPDIPDFLQKQHYPVFEIDFGRRVIGKFVFNPQIFWKDSDFPMIGKSALYPDDHDPMFSLANHLIEQLGKQE
jgi:hypothetical protein